MLITENMDISEKYKEEKASALMKKKIWTFISLPAWNFLSQALFLS